MPPTIPTDSRRVLPALLPPMALSPGSDAELAGVLALLVEAFADMEGVIDPPSSLARLGIADLRAEATKGRLWAIFPGPAACMVLTPRPDTLYLGKLAVAAAHRGGGLARVMVELAVQRARTLDLPSVTLQTRIELTANQALFQHLGFIEIARTAHAGYARPTSITYRRAV